jgi:5'-3' exonuclease
MGVPRVFQWIVNKYPKTFTKGKLPIDATSYLCFDINGLIHPCVRQSILDKGTFHLETIEKNIRAKINYLIDITKPSKGILLCIDGVAPLAKMYQQRYRRYKSIKDKELERAIYCKHGLPYPFEWDTNAITPSTDFMRDMNKLFENISSELGLKYPDCKIFYSDSDVIGEGEHKIMEIIRGLPKDPKDTFVIHGLDADLIFLSIGLERGNIYLMREQGELIGYLNVDLLKNSLFLEIQSLCKTQLVPKHIEKDFLVLSYFLGNDFLPQVFSFDILELDTLLKTYSSILDKEKRYLVFNGNIDWNILGQLCGKLGENEYFLLKKKLRKYLDMSISDTHLEDPIAKEIFSERQKLHEDPLKLLEGGWKERYYKHYFDFEHTEWPKKNAMMLNYLEGLQWNLNYYLKGIQNWLWNYKYHSAPFFSDIYHYISKKGIRDLIHSCRNIHKPTRTPSNIEQLLVVLPMQSAKLIPKPFRELVTDVKNSPLIDLYPMDYKLDSYYKQKDWEYKPVLPDIDFNRIIEAVSKVSS